MCVHTNTVCDCNHLIMCTFFFTSYTDSPGVWFNVSHCNLLKTTICNVGYLLEDSNFKVRVGIVKTQKNIFWSSKRHINIRLSEYLGYVTCLINVIIFNETVESNIVFHFCSLAVGQTAFYLQLAPDN